MENIGYIYVIESVKGNSNKIGWKYVGQSIRYGQRQNEHFRDLKNKVHHSPKLQRYYNKYSKNSLQHYILAEFPKNELDFWETFFIKCFDSKKHGFNCTDGGNSGTPKRIKCIMQNIYTGEKIKEESIAEFSRKYNVNASSLNDVVNGNQNHAGDWFCPLHSWRPILYKTISPTGEQITIFNVAQFCKLHNIPNKGDFLDMLKGRKYSCYGYKTKGREKINPREKDYLSFKLKSPSGQIFEGKNVAKFCKENGLCTTRIQMVIHGKNKQHKGWILFKEKDLCPVL